MPRQDAAKARRTWPAQGNGFVDVFNLNGHAGTGRWPRLRLVTRGQLDSPWGLASAPTGFAGHQCPAQRPPCCFVGNFGNGRINAYDATTGQVPDRH